jgi:hypothetical protein
MADLPVHQSHTGAISGGTMIKVYSLDERAGAIPHPDNGDSYFSHSKKVILPAAGRLGQNTSYYVSMSG